MTHFLENNNLLVPSQHGFRNAGDCLTELLHHFDDILTALGGGSNTDVLYLDFSNDFDKVDHKSTLKTLQQWSGRKASKVS